MDTLYVTMANRVWVCPATNENMQFSIESQYSALGEYCWAFNGKFKKKWERMHVGDVCIFGCARTGFIKAAQVKGKIDLTGVESWPIRSPSGAPWNWGFTLHTPVAINISAVQLNSIGVMSWQTQNLLDYEKSTAVMAILSL